MRFFKEHKLLTIILLLLSVYIYLNYTIMLESNTKKGKYYINALYTSNQTIYNKHLNKYEKMAYDDLLYNIKKRNQLIKVDLEKYPETTGEAVCDYYMSASDALTVDHPELYEFGYISALYDQDFLQITIFYSTHNKIMEEINTLKIQKIITDIKFKTINMNDIEKIRYVYEWIGDNTRYDHVFTHMAKNQSIYNVFIKNNAVCAGFAKASQVIFQNIGIESMTVHGYAGEAHMWNIIKYNGKYYYYDSTCAASIKDKSNKYYYGGLDQDSFKDYTTRNDWYPKISEGNPFKVK